MTVNTHASTCSCEICVGPIFARRNEEARQSQSEVITLTRAELQEELERAYRRGVAEAQSGRDLRPIEAGKALRG